MLNFKTHDELLAFLKKEMPANTDQKYAIVGFDSRNAELIDFTGEKPITVELHGFSIKDASERLYLDGQETINKLKSKGYIIRISSDGDDKAYKLAAKMIEKPPLTLQYSGWADKKQAVAWLFENNKVKDGAFMVKIKDYDELQEFLLRALKEQSTGYGLVTCESIKGGFASVTVHFGIVKKRPPRTGYAYVVDPVELLSWNLDQTITLWIEESKERLCVTYRELIENFDHKGYYLRNNRVYELDSWMSMSSIIPDELEDIKIISEEECVDWMIENCPER
jgi:hypothetical protein